MPDNAYAFKPAEEEWDFRELMHHIAYGIQWWEDNYIKGNKTEWTPPTVKGNKKDILTYLELVYGGLKKTVSDGNLSDEAVQGFHATMDHITHHRGQAVVYLRCKGLTPPEYIY
jgi:DinB family